MVTPRDDLGRLTKGLSMGLGRMDGKSVLITGAAFGIGRATAEKFADEGAHLVIQDIQAEPLRAFED